MKNLFAVCLLAGIVRIVEKSDIAKRMLEDLLVRGSVGRGHDDSMGGAEDFLIGSSDLLYRRGGEGR